VPLVTRGDLAIAAERALPQKENQHRALDLLKSRKVLSRAWIVSAMALISSIIVRGQMKSFL